MATCNTCNSTVDLALNYCSYRVLAEQRLVERLANHDGRQLQLW